MIRVTFIDTHDTFRQYFDIDDNVCTLLNMRGGVDLRFHKDESNSIGDFLIEAYELNLNVVFTNVNGDWAIKYLNYE